MDSIEERSSKRQRSSSEESEGDPRGPDSPAEEDALQVFCITVKNERIHGLLCKEFAHETGEAKYTVTSNVGSGLKKLTAKEFVQMAGRDPQNPLQHIFYLESGKPVEMQASTPRQCGQKRTEMWYADEIGFEEEEDAANQASSAKPANDHQPPKDEFSVATLDDLIHIDDLLAQCQERAETVQMKCGSMSEHCVRACAAVLDSIANIRRFSAHLSLDADDEKAREICAGMYAGIEWYESLLSSFAHLEAMTVSPDGDWKQDFLLSTSRCLSMSNVIKAELPEQSKLCEMNLRHAGIFTTGTSSVLRKAFVAQDDRVSKLAGLALDPIERKGDAALLEAESSITNPTDTQMTRKVVASLLTAKSCYEKLRPGRKGEGEWLVPKAKIAACPSEDEVVSSATRVGELLRKRKDVQSKIVAIEHQLKNQTSKLTNEERKVEALTGVQESLRHLTGSSNGSDFASMATHDEETHLVGAQSKMFNLLHRNLKSWMAACKLRTVESLLQKVQTETEEHKTWIAEEKELTHQRDSMAAERSHGMQSEYEAFFAAEVEAIRQRRELSTETCKLIQLFCERTDADLENEHVTHKHALLCTAVNNLRALLDGARQSTSHPRDVCSIKNEKTPTTVVVRPDLKRCLRATNPAAFQDCGQGRISDQACSTKCRFHLYLQSLHRLMKHSEHIMPDASVLNEVQLQAANQPVAQNIKEILTISTFDNYPLQVACVAASNPDRRAQSADPGQEGATQSDLQDMQVVDHEAVNALVAVTFAGFEGIDRVLSGEYLNAVVISGSCLSCCGGLNASATASSRDDDEEKKGVDRQRTFIRAITLYTRTHHPAVHRVGVVDLVGAVDVEGTKVFPSEWLSGDISEDDTLLIDLSTEETFPLGPDGPAAQTGDAASGVSAGGAATEGPDAMDVDESEDAAALKTLEDDVGKLSLLKSFAPDILLVLFDATQQQGGHGRKEEWTRSACGALTAVAKQTCKGRIVFFQMDQQDDHFSSADVLRGVLAGALGVLPEQENVLPLPAFYELHDAPLKSLMSQPQVISEVIEDMQGPDLAAHEATGSVDEMEVQYLEIVEEEDTEYRQPEGQIEQEHQVYAEPVQPPSRPSAKPPKGLKPQEAALMVLRGQDEGLTIDEITKACLELPQSVDCKEGVDLRSSMTHMLAVCCASTGKASKGKVFEKDGSRFRILRESKKAANETPSPVNGVGGSEKPAKQPKAPKSATAKAKESKKKDLALKEDKRSPADASALHWPRPDTLLTGTIESFGMLLDLADRIPYNSVVQPTAAVWDRFRLATEKCKTAREVAQQLIWFSEQLMPRVLKTSWLERGPDGRDSPADEWLAECHRCTEHADVQEKLRTYENMAIDWDKVASAFREEWQAKKARKHVPKNKMKAAAKLTPAEEAALAATTQLGRHLMTHAERGAAQAHSTISAQDM